MVADDTRNAGGTHRSAQTIADAVAYLSPYVHRYGLVAGARLGLGIRELRRMPVGQLQRLRVPGLAHPVVLRAGTDDAGAFQQVFVDGEHDIPVGRSPEIVIDLGAHVGLATVRFATRWPHARIWAVEPDPTNFDLLAINAQPYAPRVTCVRAAAWSKTTELAIANPEVPTVGRQCVERAAGSVAGLAMNDILDLVLAGTGRTRVDLVKMDIEGAELGVLRDPAWVERVDTLMVELHEFRRPGCREALDAAIRKTGFVESRSGEYVVLDRRSDTARAD